jgi:hypothetical protein
MGVVSSLAHHVQVCPVRVRAYDGTLHCERLQVVGYRAICSCGWRGPVRALYAQAHDRGGAHVFDALDREPWR